LCINYVMDESNLMIANRNFCTATEIRNLIPFSGLDAYRKFIQVNNWVDYYYPGISGASALAAVTQSDNLINKFFYVSYTVLRSIRWLSMDFIRKLSFKDDLHDGISFHLVSPPYGGYQALVQKKFSRLAEKWFPELLGAELIEKLFPDALSTEIRKGEVDVATIAEDIGLGDAHSKYG